MDSLPCGMYDSRKIPAGRRPGTIERCRSRVFVAARETDYWRGSRKETGPRRGAKKRTKTQDKTRKHSPLRRWARCEESVCPLINWDLFQVSRGHLLKGCVIEHVIF